jgi:hypothetical protein
MYCPICGAEYVDWVTASSHLDSATVGLAESLLRAHRVEYFVDDPGSHFAKAVGLVRVCVHPADERNAVDALRDRLEGDGSGTQPS